MLTYATKATLGDDVYFEPTTLYAYILLCRRATQIIFHSALENHIAQLFGKEAALFVGSGTQGNQIAIRTHLKQPPYSLICDKRAHIYKLTFSSSAQLTELMVSQGMKLVVRPSTVAHMSSQLYQQIVSQALRTIPDAI